MKYAFIKNQRRWHAITRLCSVLNVSTSGYYEWLDRPPCATERMNKRLLSKIRCFHQSSRQTYGSPRIHKDLRTSGEHVSVNRVAKLMKAAGIQSKMRKRFIITTNSKNTLAPAPDRLKRTFRTTQPNQAWVSDTTFIRTRQGWLYLAILLDLYSRQVTGWAMSDRNNAKLVIDALQMAIARRHIEKPVIVHSDQGSTYASGNYQQLLSQHHQRVKSCTNMHQRVTPKGQVLHFATTRLTVE